eukprot:RCo050950
MSPPPEKHVFGAGTLFFSSSPAALPYLPLPFLFLPSHAPVFLRCCVVVVFGAFWLILWPSVQHHYVTSLFSPSHHTFFSSENISTLCEPEKPQTSPLCWHRCSGAPRFSPFANALKRC